MIDYLAVFANTNGLPFPGTLGVNASGPSATDGTEYVKAFIDDIWGARQALMDEAGLTPDGVTEAPGTSQFVEALRLIGSGPGIGAEWLLNEDPGITGHRALFRYGQGVLIASYVALDAACYVGDANNAAVGAAGGGFYRASDAAGTTPDIAGPYLILPETRGMVPRGLDAAATIDPDGASRFLGDPQVDALQGHWHDVFTNGAQLQSEVNVQNGVAGVAPTTNITAALTEARTIKTDTVNGVPRISSETVMYNFSTKFIVWH